jgi:hypothetical protein
MLIDRRELIEEYKLRMEVRKLIKIIDESEKKKIMEEENKLRILIRSLIREASDPEKTPHSSTGINVLEDLLKKIIPQLEQDYKKLTTSKKQRDSFRSHIINATQNALAPESAMDQSGVVEIKEEIEMEVEDDDEFGSPDDEEAFIDIDNDGQPDEATDEELFGAGLRGDETGRNVAYAAFQKIEKAIIDSYSILAADEDRETFYDYLLTNLKLYFDKFEDELASMLPEPTTPEYEDEIENQENDESEGEEAKSAEGGDSEDVGSDAEDTGGDLEDLEDLNL